MLQTAGEVAQEPFGLGRVVLLPGLPQDLPDAGMLSSSRYVAPLVHLAALEGRRPPEGPKVIS